ncbi:MAG: hypothetical protein KDA66_18010, partial [Planctomycetaceae bacterium]|nr:hypothetical protein [Planctomycetaceae bacterium]
MYSLGFVLTGGLSPEEFSGEAAPWASDWSFPGNDSTFDGDSVADPSTTTFSGACVGLENMYIVAVTATPSSSTPAPIAKPITSPLVPFFRRPVELRRPF